MSQKARTAHTGTPGAAATRRRSHDRAPGRPAIDPRGPLVLDIRELGRRPGSMTTLSRAVPAPAELGTPMIGVAEGAELQLSARLESVVEGVLVTAHVTAPLTGECGRCLDPVADTAHVRLQELYSYPERLADLGVSADDEDALLVVDDLIDLESALRDALVLDLPLTPLCREDCPGLSSTGEKLQEPAGSDTEPLDPRWAALRGLSVD